MKNEGEGITAFTPNEKRKYIMNTIEIAYKMKRCNTTAKRFFGNEYSEKIKCYVDVVKGLMQEHNFNEAEAILHICKDEIISSNGMAVMLLMSAGVDIMEGTA